jgi:hypothetical protein
MELCDLRIRSNMYKYFNKEYMLDISYYYIPRLINNQLGLTDEEILMQMYYINQLAIKTQKIEEDENF